MTPSIRTYYAIGHWKLIQFNTLDKPLIKSLESLETCYGLNL